MDADERSKYEALGFDYPRAFGVLDEALAALGRSPFDAGRDSAHWPLFSALSQVTVGPRILEIGTFDGSFTSLLGRLFPESPIVTVDLPGTDPDYGATYGRTDAAARREFEQLLARNTANELITMVRCNSMFLLDALDALGDGAHQFDLIWVDGGHLYPVIAWDIAYAFRLCRAGGYIAVDDVVTTKAASREGYTGPATLEALRYATSRTDSTATYFVKRRGPNAVIPRLRKYVALLQTAGQAPGGNREAR